MRSLVGIVALLAGCYTDPAGNTCQGILPGDGNCPSDGGSSGTTIHQFHRYSDPNFIEVAGTLGIVVESSGKDFIAYEDYDAETGEMRDTPIAGSPELACGGPRCVAAWRDSTSRVWTAIRDVRGWSAARSLGISYRAPAVAASGDVTLVAWSRSSSAYGIATIELDKLGPDGAVAEIWTLASDASIDQLALTMSPIGGAAMWERSKSSDAPTTVVAELLDVAGAPVGVAQLEIPFSHAWIYDAPPSGLVDAAYRFGDAPDGSWFTVDAMTGTLTVEPIGRLETSDRLRQIVPTADGALITYVMDGKLVVSSVEDGAITWTTPLPVDSVVTSQSTGIQIASTATGSLSTAALGDPEPVVLAETYELDDGGGCSAGGSPGLVVVAAFAGAGLLRRRKK